MSEQQRIRSPYARNSLSLYYKNILVSNKTILILQLTDRTDCTDFFAYTTCFSTTEMTDFTDFVSIACSLRY